MKALIIGGTSSVAVALKPVLAGFSEVLTAGRKNCDLLLDLNDAMENIIFPEGIDTVIHTAAHFGGKSAKEILEAENINVLGTLKLCNAAHRAGVKHFILVSSMHVNLDENAAQYNSYTLSKKHAEEMARLFCATHGLPLSILRPSQLYGTGDGFRVHQPFFYNILDKAERGEEISFYGSHDPLRNYLHVDDLAQIISRVVRDRVEGTYSCTHPVDVTYSTIAKSAFAAFGKKESIHFLKDKPGIPDNVFESDHKLYELIGFYPAITIEEGIKRIADHRKTA